MIKGLTHSDDGIVNQVTKYRGKISTGYAPNEGPNKNNYPMACGHFRCLKEIIINETIQGKVVSRKEWRLNDPVQKLLEESLGGSTTPRKLDFLCLFANPSQLWESSLAMYSGTEGLLCKGNGSNTVAKELKKTKEDRLWVDRPCLYKECPDHKAGRCKEIGLMKVFPLIDISTNPYRFETRSINTIMGIESSLDKLWNLCKAAYMVKKFEAKKDIPFEGLFGMKLSLIHRKIKSGGREVYITDIQPTPETSAALMEPIQRGLALNQAAALTVGAQQFSLLNADIEDDVLALDAPDITPSGSMDIEDEKSIAGQFHADADKPSDNEQLLKDAQDKLLSK